MKVTYYKDTMRSYMIIPCPPEAGTTGYQYRMLEMNRIEGILPCGLRHIDGESFLYYETTGKQSLSALYEGRGIPGAELFRLLEALSDMSGTLSEYLLDEQHLVLTADQIFYDLSSGKYSFTYYPGEVISPDVFRFLADGIDGADKSAAAAAYRLCAAAGGDRQALRESVREAVSQKNTPKPWEIETEPSSGRHTQETNHEDFDRPDRYTTKTGTEADTEPSKSREPDRSIGSFGKKQLVFRILLILLLLSGAGGLIAVQLLVYISQRERRLCIAGSILLLVSACLIIAETVRVEQESLLFGKR